MNQSIIRPTKQLQDQMYDLLHGYIMQQAPGVQLESERELAVRFEVSRPTVRAALKRLENGGLVRRRQGGGTFVTEQVKRKIAQLLYYHWAGELKPDDGCYGQCLHAMRTTVEGYGHRLAVVGTDNPKQAPGPDYSLVAQQDEAAVIVTLGIMNHTYIAGLSAFERPVVTVDYDGGGAGVDGVAFDSFGAGRQMAGHLIELGHHQIAYIGRHRGLDDAGAYRGEPDSMKTAAGVEFSLKERGLSFRDDFNCEVNMDHLGEVQSQTHRLLSIESAPTAIITSCASHALSVIRTAEAVGLKVPQNLSVACYEGSDESGVSITGVAVDMKEMGEVAGHTIASRLDAPKQPKVLVNIPGRLILRGTTDVL